ncbi:MAG TPA: glycerophosphodiester phosphodiesterase [Bacilli bacterium]|nr:glycerophosphodiester phosphodiesterase [Bacilli bacterium]
MAIHGYAVKNLAHRGASGFAPENTMAAFRLAQELGADGFEFDVMLTSDGVPVVIHDETLDRTTNGHGLVQSHTFDEIRQLDAGSWYGRSFAGEKVPSLEEVLAAYGGRMFLNIELKNSHVRAPGLEEKVIELIRRYGIERQVIVSSFDHHSMAKFHGLAPDIRTGLLYECCLVDAVSYALKLGASALHPLFATINVQPELVPAAHAAGLEVNVWTVNDPAFMRQCVRAGVDAIITNYPDRLRRLLESF